MEESRHRLIQGRDNFPYKIELHVHLDGAIRLSTLFDISRRRNISLHAKDEEEYRNSFCVYHAKSLYKVLASFGNFMPVVAGDRDAIRRLAYEFCEDCSKHNIRYVETRFSPHLLANNEQKPEYALEQGDITPREVVRIVTDALKQGSRDFNIRAKAILCCMRHRPDWSDEIVELAREFQPNGVVAIDIAGGSNDPEVCVEHIGPIHKAAFKKAHSYGIHITVHAGEAGPAAKVKEAMDEMYAERIGHGYRCLQDPEVYGEVLKRRVHLEACPMSSICTGAVPQDIHQHPVVRFAADGAYFSLSSDDPLVFDSCLLDDYNAALEMGLTDEQIIVSIFNAAKASFTSEEEKEEILKELVNIYGEKYITI